MARPVYGNRALLNLPGHHTTAAIVAEVENTANWPKGKSRRGNKLSSYTATPKITCTISDCTEQVNLEFDLDTEDKLENALHKVDTLIATLTEFREGLEIEGERTIARMALIPESDRYHE